MRDKEAGELDKGNDGGVYENKGIDMLGLDNEVIEFDSRSNFSVWHFFASKMFSPVLETKL